jgi:hypothetical protein
MLTRLFAKKKSPDEIEMLRRQAGTARKLFERAMKEQGINSEAATYWANKLDDAEDQLNA